MNRAAGQANIIVIVIVILGIVAAGGGILIPRLTKNIIYSSCCNEAGGKWKKGFCTVSTPEMCTKKEQIWNEYQSCVIEHHENNANEKYKETDC